MGWLKNRDLSVTSDNTRRPLGMGWVGGGGVIRSLFSLRGALLKAIDFFSKDFTQGRFAAHFMSHHQLSGCPFLRNRVGMV